VAYATHAPLVQAERLSPEMTHTRSDSTWGRYTRSFPCRRGVGGARYGRVACTAITELDGRSLSLIIIRRKILEPN
jgi:hypothetical protein